MPHTLDDLLNSPPPEKRNADKRTLTASLLALVVAAGVTTGTAFAFGIHPGGDPIKPVVKKVPVQETKASLPTSKTPAHDAVTKIIATLDDEVEGLPQAKVRTSSGLGAPGTDACDQKMIAPVVSQTRSYAGKGSWRTPEGITVTVAAYPVGAGADALLAPTQASCKGVSASTVDERTVEGTIADASGTIRFQTWRAGDVLISVTAAHRSLPRSFIDALHKDAEEVLAPVCASIAETTDESKRSPYTEPEAFTGRFESQIVTVDKAPPTSVADEPVTDLLPLIALPTPPSGPHAPLPDPVQRPSAPTLPTYPKTSEVIDARVPDEAGPGCGWAFTSTAPAVFDGDAANAQNETLRTQAQERLRSSYDTYEQQANDYKGALVTYNEQANVYNAYVAQVEQIRVQWDQARAGEQRYLVELDAYLNSKAALDAFEQRRADAAKQYQDALNACSSASSSASSTTSSTTPTPTSTSPSSSETTTPMPTSTSSTSTISTSTSTSTTAPSPTSIPGCPPQAPEILSQTPPPLAPSPTSSAPGGVN